MSNGTFSWPLHLQCHILVCGKTPLSILVEQTASGQVTVLERLGVFCLGLDAPGTHVYPSTGEARGANHNRKEG